MHGSSVDWLLLEGQLTNYSEDLASHSIILGQYFVGDLLFKEKGYLGIFEHEVKLAKRASEVIRNTFDCWRQLVLAVVSSIFALFAHNTYSDDVPLIDDDPTQNILGTVRKSQLKWQRNINDLIPKFQSCLPRQISQ